MTPRLPAFPSLLFAKKTSQGKSCTHGSSNTWDGTGQGTAHRRKTLAKTRILFDILDAPDHVYPACRLAFIVGYFDNDVVGGRPLLNGLLRLA